MTINSISGLINWTPAVAGEQAVTVIVTNGIGLSDSKNFTIIVSPANQAPVITPIADATVTVGETFTYTIEATDPDGDTLTYSLTDSPAGMTIDENSGVITWTPTTIGSYGVTVEVSDISKSATQSFNILVDETLLTSIVVFPTTMEIAAGSSKTIISVTAHYDNATSAGIALTACTYESNKTNVPVANGVITVSSSCSATTAIITVSYTENDVTKSDNVTVTVPSGGG
jgi:hypothetical protein